MTNITVAYGDGIGPEIMEATLHILREAGADITVETIEVGERVYNMGATSGILPSAWDTLKRTKVLLKAPITTPQGKGYKSLNVTMRKTLGLYANIRPTQCFHPFVKTNHPDMDLVIVRENEEDLYAGVEYRHSQETTQCLKIITRSGCERIIRYAFEYAISNNRKKVTCMSKDNIMKMTDGIFHSVFEEVGKEYPQIQQDHYIIDIGAARIAAKPEIFDVIVTGNLYGDIISDIAAEVSGSVGLAGSSNVGNEFAMFEAIHGSAPDIAGKDIANPCGLLRGAVMMLTHIGQPEVASKVHNAMLATIESGIHTGDIFQTGISKEKVGTKAFAEAVVQHLGKTPSQLKAVDYGTAKATATSAPKLSTPKPEKKELIGVDVFVAWGGDMDELGKKMQGFNTDGLELKLLSNKGLKVWPEVGADGMNLADYFRCRYRTEGDKPVSHKALAALVARVADAGLDFMKVENLYSFDGKLGFSLAQGE